MFLISFWESVQIDGGFYLLLLALLLTVITVTWLYARTRSAHTIAELKTQLLQVQAQYNDRLFALDDECKAKLEHARLILQDLHTQLSKDDAAMVVARRNELANYTVLEYAKSVRQYARMIEPFLAESRQKQLLFIENHILPFLQQAGDILAVLNQPKVLSFAGSQPLQFFYPDFDFAFDALRDYSNIWDFGINKAARQHSKRLGF